MSRIAITGDISIDESELAESFILSSGPGGQNVNKVASAVQLRFDAAGSPSLPDEVKQRLLKLAGKRATREGVVILVARSSRRQERNREDARERLIALIRQATEVPAARRATRPTRGSVERRIEKKVIRSRTKRARGRVQMED
ncbi:MAG TPA: alternative ribosome rescue aminoacyl-tRNA hydrolase ArfB [Micropepsaceae bacterium]|nr:alternative ribosome rescue aminoacyl-tRNA hydrolase ArfB [Micropepsaceae bacterium]